MIRPTYPEPLFPAQRMALDAHFEANWQWELVDVVCSRHRRSVGRVVDLGPDENSVILPGVLYVLVHDEAASSAYRRATVGIPEGWPIPAAGDFATVRSVVIEGGAQAPVPSIAARCPDGHGHILTLDLRALAQRTVKARRSGGPLSFGVRE